MPTPFQHLDYADRVLNHPDVPPQLRELLHRQIGPFLLGTTAADVQTITGQHRLETHFYSISFGKNGAAAEAMLGQYPVLTDPRTLTPAHAAFVVGYVVHLAWDELWAWDVFVPYYLNGTQWPDRRSYHVHHNALRVWLDRLAYAGLSDRAALSHCLRQVVPLDWLPFAPDTALVDWRDWLAKQLDGSVALQTAEVFAERMGVPVVDLEAIVSQIAVGEYDMVPGIQAVVAAYEAAALTKSVAAMLRYWGIEHKLGKVAATEGAAAPLG